MNKVSVELKEKATQKKKVNDYYFAVKDAALIFINSQLEAFEEQHGKVIHSVVLEDAQIFKTTETHEIVIKVEWGKL